jgi:serine/threonine protein kinase
MYERLDSACCPEEVFGTGDDPSVVFRKLARACHPDRFPGEPKAKEVFQKLTALKDEADKRVKDGKWGRRIPLPHCIPLEIGKYKVKQHPRIGDIADLYVCDGSTSLVKVARHHDDNDLLRAEATALKLLESITTPVRDGAPKLIDNFWVEGTWKREANVISFFPGFLSAQTIHAKMPVDARTAVWMFKRIMSLLSWAHHFGIVHGAILPPHVLFYPDNDGRREIDPRKHSIRLIDWCYSIDFKQRTRLSSWVPSWQGHYAPELLSKKFIGPASDIFMAAQLIRYLCGKLPDGMEKVLTKCLNFDPAKRYQKATEVLEKWKQAAAKEFGAPKWHDFNVV